MTEGILINYEYCTGCHSCEVACKKRLGSPKGSSASSSPRRALGSTRASPRGRAVGVDVAPRPHQGVRPVRRPHGEGQDAHVRAALPGVVPVPRRGGRARAQDGRQDPLGAHGAAGEVAVRAAVAPDRARRPRGRARAAGARLRGREACESTRGSETAAGVRRWHDRGRACDGGWRASGSARAAGARTAALVWHAGVAETANARRHP